jgi:hypothetical protein
MLPSMKIQNGPQIQDRRQKPGLFGHLELLIKKCVAYPQEDFLFTILYGAFLVP